MVLQLCGRVCRRLSLKNPHHEFDEDFLFYSGMTRSANASVRRLSLICTFSDSIKISIMNLIRGFCFKEDL
jgi:hypothetical protein